MAQTEGPLGLVSDNVLDDDIIAALDASTPLLTHQFGKATTRRVGDELFGHAGIYWRVHFDEDGTYRFDGDLSRFRDLRVRHEQTIHWRISVHEVRADLSTHDTFGDWSTTGGVVIAALATSSYYVRLDAYAKESIFDPDHYFDYWGILRVSGPGIVTDWVQLADQEVTIAHADGQLFGVPGSPELGVIGTAGMMPNNAGAIATHGHHGRYEMKRSLGNVLPRQERGFNCTWKGARYTLSGSDWYSPDYTVDYTPVPAIPGAPPTILPQTVDTGYTGDDVGYSGTWADGIGGNSNIVIEIFGTVYVFRHRDLLKYAAKLGDGLWADGVYTNDFMRPFFPDEYGTLLSVEFESDRPELLSMEFAPNEKTGGGHGAQPCVASWFLGQSPQGTDDGVNPLGGPPYGPYWTPNLGTLWALDGGKPEDLVSGSFAHIADYQGQGIGSVPDFVPVDWETAVSWEVDNGYRDADTDGFFGIGGYTFVIVPSQLLETDCPPMLDGGGLPPDPYNEPSGSMSSFRGKPRMALRLEVTPVRFKGTFRPPIEPATPVYPSLTGTLGTPRTEFWPQ